MDIQKLETQYLKAKIAYYEGDPIMSDATFDILEKELKDAGSKVIEQVGSKRKDFDFPHPHPMKSLDKIQTEANNYQTEAFMQWLNKRQHLSFNSIKHMYSMPKFDGSAINIIYRNRNLEAVLTRGDGKFGKDVTDRFRKHLPSSLHIIPEICVVEIRCEAVMRKSIFKTKYANDFANARNIVAGIIGKDDIDIDAIADITLIPIHILIDDKHQYIDNLNYISDTYSIFSTGYSSKHNITEEDYLNTIQQWEKKREVFDFQLDGIVFSLPIEFRELLGENEHSTEWAVAIKFVPEEAITSVTGIEWNIGKTGEFTPVILLKPILLAGTVVKRSSGYNAGYIIDNKIGDGALLALAKSGDIIPEVQDIKIQGVVEELPKTCPYCNNSLKFDGIHLYCDNEDCVGRIARKLSYASAMLDLKGIAGKTLEPFAQDFKNMYELFVWVIKGWANKTYKVKENVYETPIEKYGIKAGSRSHEIFINAFRNIKSLTYAQVILMIGYDGVGKKLAEQVARDYCGLEPNYASMEKALVEKFKDADIRTYIENAVCVLESLGVIVDKFNNNNKNKEKMETIYCCLTGSPKNFGWKTKEEFISQFDNIEEVSITDKRCNYLITDSYESTSNKMKIAEKKGIKVVTYGDFKV